MKTQSRRKEDWLSLPVHNLPTLRHYTREKLAKYKMLLLGDVVRHCVNGKKEFVPIERRGFGVASNYDVAKFLHRRGFLSEEALAKVELPEYRYRKLTNAEIGEMKDVLVSKFQWSKTAKLVIGYVAIIGHRRYNRPEDLWKHLTVGELVKRFVRMTSYGKTVFHDRGHIHWCHSATMEAFRECLPEIKKFLYDNYFLEQIEEPGPAEEEP